VHACLTLLHLACASLPMFATACHAIGLPACQQHPSLCNPSQLHLHVCMPACAPYLLLEVLSSTPWMTGRLHPQPVEPIQRMWLMGSNAGLAGWQTGYVPFDRCLPLFLFMAFYISHAFWRAPVT
jgi:hypothetical protein